LAFYISGGTTILPGYILTGVEGKHILNVAEGEPILSEVEGGASIKTSRHSEEKSN